MALTREFLEQQGLEADVITAVMKEHGKTVNPLNDQVSQLTTSNEQLTNQLAERDTQLKDLKTDGDQSLKDKISELEQNNETLKQQHQDELNQAIKAHKVELLAKEIGTNDVEWAIDKLSKLELKDGELADSETVVAELKEKHPALFQGEQKIKPWSQGGISTVTNGNLTKKDIMAIKDRKERELAIANNLDLFN